MTLIHPARRAALACSGVAVLGLCACGDPAQPADGDVRFEVTDSAGVALVRNGLQGSWGPDPIVPREVLRIGVMEGDEPYQFSRIEDLDVASDGRILVGNDQTATVRVFDAEGRFLREFGGRGEGPGEFIMVNRVVATGEDISVIDAQAGGRLTRFSADGRVRSVWRLTWPDGVRLDPSFWTPEGWFGSVSPVGSAWEPLPFGTPDTTSREFFLLREGSPEVSRQPQVVLPPARVLYATRDGGGTRRDWGLVEVGLRAGVDGTGRFFAAGGVPYRIEVFGPDGELVRRITREYEPVPLDLEATLAAYLELAEAAFLSEAFPMGVEQGRAQLERHRERVAVQASFPVPESRPPAREFLVAPDGSFWVERVDHIPVARLVADEALSFAEAWLELEPLPSLWDIFDAEGRLLGQVELPPRFTPMRLREGRVYGVLHDELDVEYVVALEVPGAG